MTMKKLTLDPQDLRVESFEPREHEARGGTVRGHEGTGETCMMTQCGTGRCDCMLTIPPEVGC
jgi:hypothetical protein